MSSFTTGTDEGALLLSLSSTLQAQRRLSTQHRRRDLSHSPQPQHGGHSVHSGGRSFSPGVTTTSPSSSTAALSTLRAERRLTRQRRCMPDFSETDSDDDQYDQGEHAAVSRFDGFAQQGAMNTFHSSSADDVASTAKAARPDRLGTDDVCALQRSDKTVLLAKGTRSLELGHHRRFNFAAVDRLCSDASADDSSAIRAAFSRVNLHGDPRASWSQLRGQERIGLDQHSGRQFELNSSAPPVVTVIYGAQGTGKFRAQKAAALTACRELFSSPAHGTTSHTALSSEPSSASSSLMVYASFSLVSKSGLVDLLAPALHEHHAGFSSSRSRQPSSHSRDPKVYGESISEDVMGRARRTSVDAASSRDNSRSTSRSLSPATTVPHANQRDGHRSCRSSTPSRAKAKRNFLAHFSETVELSVSHGHATANTPLPASGGKMVLGTFTEQADHAGHPPPSSSSSGSAPAFAVRIEKHSAEAQLDALFTFVAGQWDRVASHIATAAIAGTALSPKFVGPFERTPRSRTSSPPSFERGGHRHSSPSTGVTGAGGGGANGPRRRSRSNSPRVFTTYESPHDAQPRSRSRSTSPLQDLDGSRRAGHQNSVSSTPTHATTNAPRTTKENRYYHHSVNFHGGAGAATGGGRGQRKAFAPPTTASHRTTGGDLWLEGHGLLTLHVIDTDAVHESRPLNSATDATASARGTDQLSSYSSRTDVKSHEAVLTARRRCQDTQGIETVIAEELPVGSVRNVHIVRLTAADVASVANGVGAELLAVEELLKVVREYHATVSDVIDEAKTSVECEGGRPPLHNDNTTRSSQRFVSATENPTTGRNRSSSSASQKMAARGDGLVVSPTTPRQTGGGLSGAGHDADVHPHEAIVRSFSQKLRLLARRCWLGKALEVDLVPHLAQQATMMSTAPFGVTNAAVVSVDRFILPFGAPIYAPPPHAHVPSAARQENATTDHSNSPHVVTKLRRPFSVASLSAIATVTGEARGIQSNQRQRQTSTSETLPGASGCHHGVGSSEHSRQESRRSSFDPSSILGAVLPSGALSSPFPMIASIAVIGTADCAAKSYRHSLQTALFVASICTVGHAAGPRSESQQVERAPIDAHQSQGHIQDTQEDNQVRSGLQSELRHVARHEEHESNHAGDHASGATPNISQDLVTEHHDQNSGVHGLHNTGGNITTVEAGVPPESCEWSDVDPPTEDDGGHAELVDPGYQPSMSDTSFTPGESSHRHGPTHERLTERYAEDHVALETVGSLGNQNVDSRQFQGAQLEHVHEDVAMRCSSTPLRSSPRSSDSEVNEEAMASTPDSDRTPTPHDFTELPTDTAIGPGTLLSAISGGRSHSSSNHSSFDEEHDDDGEFGVRESARNEAASVETAEKNTSEKDRPVASAPRRIVADPAKIGEEIARGEIENSGPAEKHSTSASFDRIPSSDSLVPTPTALLASVVDSVQAFGGPISNRAIDSEGGARTTTVHAQETVVTSSNSNMDTPTHVDGAKSSEAVAEEQVPSAFGPTDIADESNVVTRSVVDESAKVVSKCEDSESTLLTASSFNTTTSYDDDDLRDGDVDVTKHDADKRSDGDDQTETRRPLPTPPDVELRADDADSNGIIQTPSADGSVDGLSGNDRSSDGNDVDATEDSMQELVFFRLQLKAAHEKIAQAARNVSSAVSAVSSAVGTPRQGGTPAGPLSREVSNTAAHFAAASGPGRGGQPTMARGSNDRRVSPTPGERLRFDANSPGDGHALLQGPPPELAEDSSRSSTPPCASMSPPIPTPQREAAVAGFVGALHANREALDTTSEDIVLLYNDRNQQRQFVPPPLVNSSSRLTSRQDIDRVVVGSPSDSSPLCANDVVSPGASNSNQEQTQSINERNNSEENQEEEKEEEAQSEEVEKSMDVSGGATVAVEEDHRLQPDGADSPDLSRVQSESDAPSDDHRMSADHSHDLTRSTPGHHVLHATVSVDDIVGSTLPREHLLQADDDATASSADSVPTPNDHSLLQVTTESVPVHDDSVLQEEEEARATAAAIASERNLPLVEPMRVSHVLEHNEQANNSSDEGDINSPEFAQARQDFEEVADDDDQDDDLADRKASSSSVPEHQRFDDNTRPRHHDPFFEHDGEGVEKKGDRADVDAVRSGACICDTTAEDGALFVKTTLESSDMSSSRHDDDDDDDSSGSSPASDATLSPIGADRHRSFHGPGPVALDDDDDDDDDVEDDDEDAPDDQHIAESEGQLKMKKVMGITIGERHYGVDEWSDNDEGSYPDGRSDDGELIAETEEDEVESDDVADDHDVHDAEGDTNEGDEEEGGYEEGWDDVTGRPLSARRSFETTSGPGTPPPPLQSQPRPLPPSIPVVAISLSKNAVPPAPAQYSNTERDDERGCGRQLAPMSHVTTEFIPPSSVDTSLCRDDSDHSGRDSPAPASTRARRDGSIDAVSHQQQRPGDQPRADAQLHAKTEFENADIASPVAPEVLDGDDPREESMQRSHVGESDFNGDANQPLQNNVRHQTDSSAEPAPRQDVSRRSQSQQEQARERIFEDLERRFQSRSATRSPSADGDIVPHTAGPPRPAPRVDLRPTSGTTFVRLPSGPSGSANTNTSMPRTSDLMNAPTAVAPAIDNAPLPSVSEAVEVHDADDSFLQRGDGDDRRNKQQHQASSSMPRTSDFMSAPTTAPLPSVSEAVEVHDADDSFLQRGDGDDRRNHDDDDDESFEGSLDNGDEGSDDDDDDGSAHASLHSGSTAPGDAALGASSMFRPDSNPDVDDHSDDEGESELPPCGETRSPSIDEPLVVPRSPSIDGSLLPPTSHYDPSPSPVPGLDSRGLSHDGRGVSEPRQDRHPGLGVLSSMATREPSEEGLPEPRDPSSVPAPSPNRGRFELSSTSPRHDRRQITHADGDVEVRSPVPPSRSVSDQGRAKSLGPDRQGLSHDHGEVDLQEGREGALRRTSYEERHGVNDRGHDGGDRDRGYEPSASSLVVTGRRFGDHDGGDVGGSRSTSLSWSAPLSSGTSMCWSDGTPSAEPSAARSDLLSASAHQRPTDVPAPFHSSGPEHRVSAQVQSQTRSSDQQKGSARLLQQMDDARGRIGDHDDAEPVRTVARGMEPEAQRPESDTLSWRPPAAPIAAAKPKGQKPPSVTSPLMNPQAGTSAGKHSPVAAQAAKFPPNLSPLHAARSPMSLPPESPTGVTFHQAHSPTSIMAEASGISSPSGQHPFFLAAPTHEVQARNDNENESSTNNPNEEHGRDVDTPTRNRDRYGHTEGQRPVADQMNRSSASGVGGEEVSARSFSGFEFGSGNAGSFDRTDPNSNSNSRLLRGTAALSINTACTDSDDDVGHDPRRQSRRHDEDSSMMVTSTRSAGGTSVDFCGNRRPRRGVSVNVDDGADDGSSVATASTKQSRRSLGRRKSSSALLASVRETRERFALLKAARETSYEPFARFQLNKEQRQASDDEDDESIPGSVQMEASRNASRNASFARNDNPFPFGGSVRSASVSPPPTHPLQFSGAGAPPSQAGTSSEEYEHGKTNHLGERPSVGDDGGDTPRPRSPNPAFGLPHGHLSALGRATTSDSDSAVNNNTFNNNSMVGARHTPTSVSGGADLPRWHEAPLLQEMTNEEIEAEIEELKVSCARGADEDRLAALEDELVIREQESSGKDETSADDEENHDDFGEEDEHCQRGGGRGAHDGEDSDESDESEEPYAFPIDPRPRPSSPTPISTVSTSGGQYGAVPRAGGNGVDGPNAADFPRNVGTNSHSLHFAESQLSGPGTPYDGVTPSPSPVPQRHDYEPHCSVRRRQHMAAEMQTRKPDQNIPMTMNCGTFDGTFDGVDDVQTRSSAFDEPRAAVDSPPRRYNDTPPPPQRPPADRSNELDSDAAAAVVNTLFTDPVRGETTALGTESSRGDYEVSERSNGNQTPPPKEGGKGGDEPLLRGVGEPSVGATSDFCGGPSLPSLLSALSESPPALDRVGYAAAMESTMGSASASLAQFEVSASTFFSQSRVEHSPAPPVASGRRDSRDHNRFVVETARGHQHFPQDSNDSASSIRESVPPALQPYALAKHGGEHRGDADLATSHTADVVREDDHERKQDERLSPSPSNSPPSAPFRTPPMSPESPPKRSSALSPSTPPPSRVASAPIVSSPIAGSTQDTGSAPGPFAPFDAALRQQQGDESDLQFEGGDSPPPARPTVEPPVSSPTTPNVPGHCQGARYGPTEHQHHAEVPSQRQARDDVSLSLARDDAQNNNRGMSMRESSRSMERMQGPRHNRSSRSPSPFESSRTAELLRAQIRDLQSIVERQALDIAAQTGRTRELEAMLRHQHSLRTTMTRQGDHPSSPSPVGSGSPSAASPKPLDETNTTNMNAQGRASSLQVLDAPATINVERTDDQGQQHTSPTRVQQEYAPGAEPETLGDFSSLQDDVQTPQKKSPVANAESMKAQDDTVQVLESHEPDTRTSMSHFDERTRTRDALTSDRAPDEPTNASFGNVTITSSVAEAVRIVDSTAAAAASALEHQRSATRALKESLEVQSTDGAPGLNTEDRDHSPIACALVDEAIEREASVKRIVADTEADERHEVAASTAGEHLPSDSTVSVQAPAIDAPPLNRERSSSVVDDLKQQSEDRARRALEAELDDERARRAAAELRALRLEGEVAELRACCDRIPGVAADLVKQLRSGDSR